MFITDKRQELSFSFIMFDVIYFLVVLLIFPLRISSLIHCYDCKETLLLNYTMTNETVPAISSLCRSKFAHGCMANIHWNFASKTTLLSIGVISSLPVTATFNDAISAQIQLTTNVDNETFSLIHDMNYVCNSASACNSENGLRKLLRSVIIQDKFREELPPLIKVVSPFVPQEADCLAFNNASFTCPPSDLLKCKRCSTTIVKFSPNTNEICSACNPATDIRNRVGYFRSFTVFNRTQDLDIVGLACQTKNCNSFENIKRIYQAGSIQFNSTEFFH